MEVDRHSTFGENTFRLCDTRVKNKTYFRHFTLLLLLLLLMVSMLLPCPPYLILLFYRLVFYNFFLAGTWIKLRRVMQTFVRYFPDEASQVRPRPSRYQPYYLIRTLFPIVNVSSKDKYIILEFVCVTFIKCGISVIERQNNWQIFSQVIFETTARPPTQLGQRAPNYSVLCGLWYFC